MHTTGEDFECKPLCGFQNASVGSCGVTKLELECGFREHKQGVS